MLVSTPHLPWLWGLPGGPEMFHCGLRLGRNISELLFPSTWTHMQGKESQVLLTDCFCTDFSSVILVPQLYSQDTELPPDLSHL